MKEHDARTSGPSSPRAPHSADALAAGTTVTDEQALLHQHLDGELDEATQERVEGMLRESPQLQQDHDALRRMHIALRQHVAVQTQQTKRDADAIFEALEAKLNDDSAGLQRVATVHALSTEKDKREGSKRPRPWGLAFGLAAAAFFPPADCENHRARFSTQASSR